MRAVRKKDRFYVFKMKKMTHYMASVEIKDMKNRWERVSEQILNICLPKNICQYFLLHTVPRSTGV